MIISKFYLIRGDGRPIYVGFTNRTIQQRFTEHKYEKDFSEYSTVTVELIDEISYNFTWDEKVLYSNANEVSLHEEQLVDKYGTQNSPYQKAMGGGQVWSYEKWFVHNNKGNPKFINMSGSDIERYIEEEHEIDSYMEKFIGNMREPAETYIEHFIDSMVDPVEVFMKNFVGNMSDPVDIYMKNFVNDFSDPVNSYMKSFVNNMQDPVVSYMSNFINHMEDPVETYMRSFVGNMSIKEK